MILTTDLYIVLISRTREARTAQGLIAGTHLACREAEVSLQLTTLSRLFESCLNLWCLFSYCALFCTKLLHIGTAMFVCPSVRMIQLKSCWTDSD